MIRYEQVGDGTPKDVVVITDDKNAEMIDLEDLIEQGDFHVPEFADAKPDEEGLFRFTIEGGQVADFADVVWDVDNGLLEQQLQEWNEKAREDALKAHEDAGT